MAKPRVSFLCRSCGAVHRKWLGRCPDCGAWDALERYVERAEKADRGHAELASTWSAAAAADDDGPSAPNAPLDAGPARATPLIEIKPTAVDRIPTGVGELDRVLGGGLVPGAVVLLGGDPGIGKSTLLLQAAVGLAQNGDDRVLYVTSEESAYQTRLRAERVMGPDARAENLFVLADTNLGRIVEQARVVAPTVLVLDSIQMVYKADLEAAPGSVSQIRRCCTELVYLAKVAGMAIVLVGHVTKDGQLAGPKLLEHLVDAVLSFEGDRHHAHRVVRGIKNRFGTTLEVGLFEMTGAGLVQVTELGAGIDADAPPRPGSAITPVMHGSRCLLVEVQALTAPGIPGAAKRRTSGVDGNRLAMLVAVLEQHGGLRLLDQDIFASAVGGLRVSEPAADLALAMSIAGAHLRRALPPRTAVFGEVGLGGEVRIVSQPEPRLREARRLGFERVLAHPAVGEVGVDGIEVVRISDIAEALHDLSIHHIDSNRSGSTVIQSGS